MEIDLGKLHHNALMLVTQLRERGISVTGVTKATLGSPEIANTWIKAGVTGLGDSRIETIGSMRLENVETDMILIRSPMLSQVDQVITFADASCNTELTVMRELSASAKRANKSHGIILMVELGDLREGIMPALLERTVSEVLRLPNLTLKGIGTNLACRSGVSPDDKKMGELTSLTNSIESTFGIVIDTVSGGNSANLEWALGNSNTGRINNLRLGEAMLLGREPLYRQAIKGLHTDAFTLVAEVIESNTKPSKPWGEIAQSAFGEMTHIEDRGMISQSILAIGRQDIDSEGLTPPQGISILGASSDHLIVESCCDFKPLTVGSEVPFQVNYSVLLRAMTSPFITKSMSIPPGQIRLAS